MIPRLLLAAALAAASSSVLPAPALSATPEAERLEQYGFLGEWAVRCGAPASPSNVHRRAFISASGEPGFTEWLGENFAENVYRILAAERDGNQVVLDIELNGKITQRLTMIREDGRIRTLTNELGDGRVVVKNGKIVANGAPTPWLTLCQKSP